MKKGVIIASLVILAINGVRIASRLSTTSSTTPELPPASVAAALDALKQHNFDAAREASNVFKYPAVCKFIRKGERLGLTDFTENRLMDSIRGRGYGYTPSQEEEILAAVYDRCQA